MSTWRVWIRGLVAAYISGSASWILGMAIEPSQSALVLKLAALHGLTAAAAYLKQSPVPGGPDKRGESL